MSMQAKNAVRIYKEVRKELETSEQGVPNTPVERANAEAHAKRVALALTQSLLVAQAIENTLFDIGPLISTAIDNVSERLAS